MAVFFMQAVVIANWFPRIPDIQAKLAIGPAQLSIALLGFSAAMFLSILVAGPLIGRFGPRRMIIAAFAAYSVMITLPGWAWNVPSLFAALFLVGLSFPLVDVAMNVEAARIEEMQKRRILSTCHGFWSVGSMIGALIGAGAAEIGMETRWHLLLVAVVALPIALAVGFALPHIEPIRTQGRRSPFALPSWSMIGLCFFIFGVVMIEVATRTWTAPYLREVIGVSPGATGLGFAAFALAMAIGRFLGDRLSERLGPVALSRGCCALALIGLALLVIAEDLAQTVIALAAAGFGCSVGFPLAVSAAADRGDRPAAINVAALSLFAGIGGMVGPTSVGLVAEAEGLRIGLAVLLAAALLSTLLAGELRRRPKPRSKP